MKLIFTNGCFDVLHVGHVKLLEYCHSLAYKTPGGPGRVVVGLNSDDSVRKLKGSTRPVNTETDREYVLKSLRFVDDVYIFKEDTPKNLINLLSPDVIVKGGDWEASDVAKIIEQDVNKIKIFNYIEGMSTTNILKKLEQ